MIGYKTIEEFTLDDCQKNINSDNKNELSIQVKEHQAKLLVKLQKDDDDKFYACKTKKDYQAYVDSYSSSVIGKSGCGGVHISEAQDIIKKWPYRIIKFICGIILSAYLIPMTISILYFTTDQTNDFYVHILHDDPRYGSVLYSSRWDYGTRGGVLRFSPYVENNQGWRYLNETQVNTLNTELTESYMLTIAKEIQKKTIICNVIWFVFHILCQVLVYKKLIKNNLKYIFTK